MINEDTRQYRIETDRKKLAILRQNQDVQKFLKDQMIHIENNKKVNLQKKGLDGMDAVSKDFAHRTQMKMKIDTKRAMFTDTAMHNMHTSNERNLRNMMEKEAERQQSYREVTDDVQQAAFLQKLEKKAEQDKILKHRQDLENSIAERARISHYGRMPVTNETLR